MKHLIIHQLPIPVPRDVFLKHHSGSTWNEKRVGKKMVVQKFGQNTELGYSEKFVSRYEVFKDLGNDSLTSLLQKRRAEALVITHL